MLINNETNKTNTKINTIQLFKEIGLPIIFVIVIIICSITCKYLIKSNINQRIIKHFLPKRNKLNHNMQHIDELLNDESSDDTPIPSKICPASSSDGVELYKI